VKHERQPFCRRQRVEHDLKRQPDRVGEQDLVLRVELIAGGDDRIGHVQAARIRVPHLACLQRVQTHARDDRREPSGHVLHAINP